MNTTFNMKEIERKAFRSTYQDGLWDIYYGLIVVSLAIFMHRPESGYSWVNIASMTLIFAMTYGLLFAGKKFITAPRLGNVVFGETRKRKKRTMSIILAILISLQVLLLFVTGLGWLYTPFNQLFGQLVGGRSEFLFVSLIGAAMVCTGMSIIAFFTDFMRGYYISFLMSLAVFLMLYINEPVIPILIGVLIILPGLFLLVRFLRKYPRISMEQEHE